MFNKDIYQRFYTYFKQRHGLREYRRGWLKGNCPYCGKEDKFGVNVSRDRVNCFVCGGHGSLMNSLLSLENLDTYADGMKYLGSLTSIEEYNVPAPQIGKQEVREIVETILPKGYTLLNQGNSEAAKIFRRYVKKRGFDIDKVSSKGWGYTSGNEDYMGYLIIPYFKDNKIVYYNARLVFGDGPRYRNPDMTENNNVGKSMLYYNADALNLYDSIFITEGAINAETMGDRAISSGGKYLSHHQINDIVKSDVERVTLLLDPDALKQSIEVALRLVQIKAVRVVILPHIINNGEIKYLDCNDLGREKVMDIVRETPYMSYSDIIKLKNDYDKKQRQRVY